MNAPHAIMRMIRRSGGRIVRAETRYDHEHKGRVLQLEAFWPDYSGYDEVEAES